MSIKFSLRILAGAVSLALAGGALANTSGDVNGTIFLTVNDLYTNPTTGVSDNTSYVFDTGLSTASFTGTSSYSHNLSGDAAFQSFLSSISPGQQGQVSYSVIGSGGDDATTIPKDVVTYTSSQLPSATNKGSAVHAAYNDVAQFIAGVSNPSNGSTFIPASNAAAGWSTGGFETKLNGQLVANDGAGFNTPLAFYVSASNNPKSTSIAAIQSQFAGLWNLTAAGLLTYSTLPTPLPAPLLLLLSGLGLTAIISRRRGSSVERMDGALA